MAASTGPFMGPIQPTKKNLPGSPLLAGNLPTWRVSRSWSKRLVSNPARSPSPAVAVALTGGQVEEVWNLFRNGNQITILVLKCENHWLEYWNILWQKFKFWFSCWDLGCFQIDDMSVPQRSRGRRWCDSRWWLVASVPASRRVNSWSNHLTYLLPKSDILDVHFIA